MMAAAAPPAEMVKYEPPSRPINQDVAAPSSSDEANVHVTMDYDRRQIRLKMSYTAAAGRPHAILHRAGQFQLSLILPGLSAASRFPGRIRSGWSSRRSAAGSAGTVRAAQASRGLNS